MSNNTLSNQNDCEVKNIIIRKNKKYKKHNKNLSISIDNKDKNSIEIIDLNSSNSFSENKKTMLYSENLNNILSHEDKNEGVIVNISSLSIDKSEISQINLNKGNKNNYIEIENHNENNNSIHDSNSESKSNDKNETQNSQNENSKNEHNDNSENYEDNGNNNNENKKCSLKKILIICVPIIAIGVILVEFFLDIFK